MGDFPLACYNGDIPKIQNLISQGKNERDWKWDFRTARARGHLQIVDLLISKGVKPRNGLIWWTYGNCHNLGIKTENILLYHTYCVADE